MTRPFRLLALVLLASFGQSVMAQQGDQLAVESGIPINNETVLVACGTCHATDDPNILSRISFRRTTPEGWQQTIKRMISLNDLSIEPEEAREVVQYLSNHLGLAPEEAKAGAFEVERRFIEHRYEADQDVETTCRACHSLGRIINQRRTREEWSLVVGMHRGFYPLVDLQGFRETGMVGREPADENETPARRHPMNRAIDHLAMTYPLHTSAWDAWSANVRPLQLEGAWTLAGHHPGRGPVYGRVIVTAGSRVGEFVTEARLTYARDGLSITHTGRSIVYAGFQWRGSSSLDDSEESTWRQVMFLERDRQSMSGRWFRGAYNEIGIDVRLQRVDTRPLLSGIYPSAIMRNVETHELKIYGANLPSQLGLAELDLGTDVDVTDIVSVSQHMAIVRIAVEDSAAIGARDVFIGQSMLPSALTVYDRIDRITVEPMRGLARVGGIVVPKQLQQFEAIAWHAGSDGKSRTDDDLVLGVVEPTWSLEEYSATFNDEDLNYVGSIDQSGLFTPAVDGPNPDRLGNRNNIGDVWVVASVTQTGEMPIRGRAHLLVTVPNHLRWDSWETGR